MKKSHIVIDGGPCAGKTTGLAVLKQRLEEVGKTVVIIPEAATMYFTMGFNPETMTPLELQRAIFKLQLQNEAFCIREATARYGGAELVFLYDRGLATGSAYLFGDRNERVSIFEDEVMQGHKLHGIEALYLRYDAVIHMVTAAIGAPEAYTLENNSARRESNLDHAVALDHRTREAWLGHRHLRVISNTRENQPISFDTKIDHLVASVFESLGYPQPIEIEDKFLLASFDTSLLPSNEVVNIEQIYLHSNLEERVRIRETRSSKSYYHTVKQNNPNGEGRIELERLITKREADDLLTRRDVNLFPIKKKRYCFLFENQYFEVDVFQDRLTGLVMCERERSHENDKTVLPDFLDVVKDVTDDAQYKNKYLASLERYK